MKKLFCLFILVSLPVYSDYFHNIQGFYGERVAGLGGAYTAVSDDPSGAYYNPAGIAFAFDNSISISASNYKIITKKYENVDSPSQTYTQTSKTYLPNFIGVVKNMGKYKIAISVVNTLNDSFNRNSQIIAPLFSSTINNTKIYNLENYNRYLFGPSIAYSLNNKLSLGATLYFFEDTQQISRTYLQQYTDGSYVSQSYVDNRRTLGLNPILGLQYMATRKISLGFSLRQKIVTSGNRLYSKFYVDSLQSTSAYNVDLFEGTHRANASAEGSYITWKRPLNKAIPQNQEYRFGLAWFATTKMMLSTDFIYTTAYSQKKDNTDISVGPNARVIWNNNEILELNRQATLNYALGVEYFLTDILSISAGMYTNKANTKDIKWIDSAIDVSIRSLIGTELVAKSGNDDLVYSIPRAQENPRNEHVNNIGYSLGLSWATAKASISLSIVREAGRGQSRIDVNSLSQPLLYNGFSIYLVATSKG